VNNDDREAAFQQADEDYLLEHPWVRFELDRFTELARLRHVDLPTDSIWLMCPRGHHMWTVRAVERPSGNPGVLHEVPPGATVNGKILLTNNGESDGGDVHTSINHYAGSRTIAQCQDPNCRYRCVTHSLAVTASVFAALVAGRPTATIIETREQWAALQR
jgi:hypothetical protein